MLTESVFGTTQTWQEFKIREGNEIFFNEESLWPIGVFITERTTVLNPDNIPSVHGDPNTQYITTTIKLKVSTKSGNTKSLIWSNDFQERTAAPVTEAPVWLKEILISIGATFKY